MARPKKQLLDLLREQEGRLPQAGPSMKDAVGRARPMSSHSPRSVLLWLGPLLIVVAVLLTWNFVVPSGAEFVEPDIPLNSSAHEAAVAQDFQKEYGVRLITYEGTMQGRARDVALELKAQGVPELRLLQILGQFVIFAGRANRAADLQPFLSEVKQMTLASAPSKFPFASAIIEPWPTLKKQTP